jgi:hypothetical protein
MADKTIPGWEGAVGPFKSQYGEPHVYARDIHSGAGNCVCGSGLPDWVHVQAAPGVPIPDSMRPRRLMIKDSHLEDLLGGENGGS